MAMEIEVFEYLQARASIKGMNIDDLQNLLLDSKKEKSYKNLVVRMVSDNFILILDTNTGKNIFLSCVKDFHDVKENECYRIRKELGTYNEEQGQEACVKCHLKCIEKIKSGQF